MLEELKEIPIPLVIEVAFSALVILLCWMIYFRTRESYELSKHEGLRYFRGAFLFFGLSYLIRFLIGITFLSAITFDVIIPQHIHQSIFLLAIGFCSTMGIFYLLASSLHKRGRFLLPIGYLLAVLLSVITVLLRSYAALLVLQTVLLIVVIALNIHKGRIKQPKVLYILVAALWLVNLWFIHMPARIPLGVRALCELVSLAVLFIIYHRVAKWVK